MPLRFFNEDMHRGYIPHVQVPNVVFQIVQDALKRFARAFGLFLREVFRYGWNLSLAFVFQVVQVQV